MRNPQVLLLKNPTGFLNQINNYQIDNGILKWPFGLENAELVLKNSFRFNTIFSMLNSINFCDELSLHLDTVQIEENPLLLETVDLEDFPFYDSNLSAQDYFNTNINPLFENYLSFVRSSFFYLLTDVFIENKRYRLIKFMRICCLFLKTPTSVDTILIDDLKKNNIVQNFTLELLESLHSYFDEETILRISKHRSFRNLEEAYVFSPFLTLFDFYFSKKFVFTCIRDCYENNNIVPLVVALRVYEVKLAVQYEPSLENYFYEKFKIFKKFLVSNRLIKKRFLIILLKKNNYIEIDSEIKFQAIGLLLCGTFAAFSLQHSFNLDKTISNPPSFSGLQQRATVQAQTRLLNTPGFTQTANSKPGFISKTISKITRGRFSLSPPAATVSDILFEDQPIFGNHEFHYKRTKYIFQTFKIKGIQYWSPYGINGRFETLEKLLKKLNTHIKRNFPNHILFGGQAVPDHIQTVQAREGLNITREEAIAVIVPADLNPIRTNNQDLTDKFTNFDYRIPSTALKSQLNLKYLFYNRQLHAIARTKLIMSKNGPKVQGQKKKFNFNQYWLISPQVELGYREAADKEYNNIIEKFCREHKINPEETESYLAFNDCMLLNSRTKDLHDATTYYSKYKTVISESMLTPNYLIEQIIKGALIQANLGQDFRSLIQIPHYCKDSLKKHKNLDREVISLLNKIVDNSKTIDDFNKLEATVAIANFKTQLKKVLSQNKVVSLQKVQEFINGNNNYNLELGNFYSKTKNGRVFDRTFETAFNLMKDDGIQRIIVINNPDQISTTSQELAENELAGNDPYLTKMAKNLLDTAIDQTSLRQTIKDLNEQADPFSEADSFSGFNLFSLKNEKEESEGKDNQNDGGPGGGGPSEGGSSGYEGMDGGSDGDEDPDGGPGGDGGLDKDLEGDPGEGPSGGLGGSRDDQIGKDRDRKPSGGNSSGRKPRSNEESNKPVDKKRYGPPTTPAQSFKIPAYRK